MVLLGALINHVLTLYLWFKEYVVANINAAPLVTKNFRGTEDLGVRIRLRVGGDPAWS